jgi:hypothetical protein
MIDPGAADKTPDGSDQADAADETVDVDVIDNPLDLILSYVDDEPPPGAR